MRSGRNNVLAGSLVLASVLGAVVVVILLAGGLERLGKRAYTVRFTLDQGVTGLETGSKVYLGGRGVGVVSRISFGRSEADQIRDILVTIRLERSVALHEGAGAQLNTPLLGGSASLNFPTIGAGRLLGEDDLIEGLIATPGIFAQAGYGPEQSEQLRRILQGADEFTARMGAITDNADAMFADARAVLTDARGRSGAWFERLDSISKNLDDFAVRAPELARNIEDRLAQLRAVIDENRENLRAALASAKSMSARADALAGRVEAELFDLARGILEEGRDAVTTARGALTDAAALLDEQSPGVRRSLANFRLSSDELLVMMNEVRRSPWRLLYRPDRRETNFELLYDSARAYAGAVSDLRAAAEAARALLSAGAATPEGESAEGLRGLVTDLDESFEKYRAVEREFLRRIMEADKAK